MAEGRRAPQPGDLIEIVHPLGYRHWALYVGQDYVIHVTDVGARDVFLSVGVSSILTGTATVKKELLEDVVKNHSWCVNNKHDQRHTPRPVEEIIQSAERCVGIRFQYSLVKNNCEHFVTLLRYDKQFSKQVEVAAYALSSSLFTISAIITIAWKKFSDKKKPMRTPNVQAGVWNEEREIPGDLAVEVHEPAELSSYASHGHRF